MLLIAGDFFTKVNPHPRYILEVIRKLKEVAKSGIKTLIITGNHETPRIATTLNPLLMIGEVEGVRVVLEPTTVSIDGYDFVCVPAPSNFDEMKNLFGPMLTQALKDSKSDHKVLVTHIPLGQAVTSSEQTLESFIGDTVDVKQIPSKFEYVALGHIHRFQKVPHDSMPIYYPGSSERHEFGEEKDDKYAILGEFSDSSKITPIKLTTRPMVTLVDADCRGLSARKISKTILERIDNEKSNIASYLVRIKLENVDVDESRLIDWPQIKTRLQEANVFDYKLQPRTIVSLPESRTLGEGYILPPSKEVELYVKAKPEYKGKTEIMLKLASEIIREAKEVTPSET